MLRTIVVAGLLLFLTGCESAECKKMQQCCQQVADEDWVGDACGTITENIHDPQSCASVTQAIVVAAEERKQEIPAVCQ